MNNFARPAKSICQSVACNNGKMHASNPNLKVDFSHGFTMRVLQIKFNAPIFLIIALKLGTDGIRLPDLEIFL